jgi:excisionase family DNA binding protein
MSTDEAVSKPGPEVLSVGKSEAARLLGVSVRTVDRLIALKQLPVRRLGRRVLIARSTLQNLLRTDHPTKAA